MTISSIVLVPPQAAFNEVFEKNLLNGILVLEAKAIVIQVDSGGRQVSTLEKPIRIIPYYAWANRGKGEMMIWFPETVKGIDLLTE